MPMEEQLTVGKVYISAFLQATLLGKNEYRSLFKDFRSGLEWLPQTIYLNQYEDSNWQTIADFEEMAKVSLSTTIPIATGERLATKYEFTKINK